ncbi:hypothetical protein Taro_031214, partial [Colocasia esculenta]|nr:hypothetical protein [Colocasia esculenta]
MEAVRREHIDGGEVGGGDGGGSGEEGAAPRRRPLSLPLLHPLAASAKQHKERHIVAWTQQEDDLLREQVGIHGTENWTCIATQFKDKTGRQCRRRWYSYLSTECKKGGWSQEEDMILCEAQKIFGNRWTEIAKVVSGRTDNAVKNRFTTLCKKRAKNENNCSYPPPNDENGLHQIGCVTAVPREPSKAFKKIRCQIATPKGNGNINEGSLGEDEREMGNNRLPLAVLLPKLENVVSLPDEQHSANNLKSVQNDENELNEFQGSFNGSNCPKFSALTQQRELQCSLAQRLCADGSDHTLENAWRELKDYLVQNGDPGPASSEVSQVDFLVDDVKDMADDSRSSSTGGHPSIRQSIIHEHSHLIPEHSSVSSDIPADSKVLGIEEPATRCDSKMQILPADGMHIGRTASQ